MDNTTEETQQQQQPQEAEGLKRVEPNPTKLPETITVAELTEDTRSVLSHFGLDAPHLLNVYSTRLEDALIEQVYRNKDLKEKNDELYYYYRELEVKCLRQGRMLKTIKELNHRQEFKDISKLLTDED